MNFLPHRRANPEAMMSLVDHLRELRYRVIICLCGIGVTTAFGYWWYSHAFSLPTLHGSVRVPSFGEILTSPYCSLPSPPRAQFTSDGSCKLLSVGLIDQFMLRFKAALTVGVILACPVWLFHLWRFIAPGLKKKEKSYTSFFVVSASLLFICGTVLAFSVLPQAFHFLLQIGDNVQVTALQGDKYFSFVTNVLIIFGFSFELPVIVIALNFARILPAKHLLKFQRGIIFALFVFAAIVTPGQDPLSMLALAAALMVLFELSVLICVIHDKLVARKDAHALYTDISDDEASPLEKATQLNETEPLDDTNMAAYGGLSDVT